MSETEVKIALADLMALWAQREDLDRQVRKIAQQILEAEQRYWAASQPAEAPAGARGEGT